MERQLYYSPPLHDCYVYILHDVGEEVVRPSVLVFSAIASEADHLLSC